jgi:hypothetical protein
VRFSDTSALIPLFMAERGTKRTVHWLREDPEVVVRTLTRVQDAQRMAEVRAALLFALRF